MILRNPLVAKAAARANIAMMGFAVEGTRSTRVERVLISGTQYLGSSSISPDLDSLSDQEIVDLEEVCKNLKSSGIATHCSPNYRYEVTGGTPNDPLFSSQYHSALMKVPDAWEITTGSPAVIVSVIDTGIMLAHQDLAANIWTNPFEVADGLDNDGNGLIDDLHGYDWVNDDSNPADDNGHGTLVAGIIGAVGNNGKGVVGVNQVVKIQALKALSNQGTGYLADFVAAIDYAINTGSNVINMSFGFNTYSEVFKAAVERAGSHGVLVVCGAGNYSSNNNSTPFYPASFQTANNISVAATDQADMLTSISNYGSTTVHLGAPGIGIWTTGMTGGYGTAQGTSMASPQVAGAAALVKATNSALGPSDLKAVLLENVDQVVNLNGMVSSGGRLNVHRAVLAALSRTPDPAPEPSPDPIPPAEEREVAFLQLSSKKPKLERVELFVVALDSATDQGANKVVDTAVSITCRETSGRKLRHRKRGPTNSIGIFAARFALQNSKLRCQAVAENGIRSASLLLRKRR